MANSRIILYIKNRFQDNNLLARGEVCRCDFAVAIHRPFQDTKMIRGSVVPIVDNWKTPGQGHQNMQPYPCANFIIALQGIYPFRS
jgi:microcystin-dependent protein